MNIAPSKAPCEPPPCLRVLAWGAHRGAGRRTQQWLCTMMQLFQPFPVNLFKNCSHTLRTLQHFNPAKRLGPWRTDLPLHWRLAVKAGGLHCYFLPLFPKRTQAPGCSISCTQLPDQPGWASFGLRRRSAWLTSPGVLPMETWDRGGIAGMLMGFTPECNPAVAFVRILSQKLRCFPGSGL